MSECIRNLSGEQSVLPIAVLTRRYAWHGTARTGATIIRHVKYSSTTFCSWSVDYQLGWSDQRLPQLPTDAARALLVLPMPAMIIAKLM
jgi:hypothetical protein